MNENIQINFICFPFLLFVIKIFNVESFYYCKEV